MNKLCITHDGFNYRESQLDGREGSDLKSYNEVVKEKCYFQRFDIKFGEGWLDLGANVGAFAFYALNKGASVTCYEPDLDCFETLKLNADGASLVPASVSALPTGFLQFSGSNKSDNRWRGTLLPTPEEYVEKGTVLNINGGFLVGQSYDGVKMDIEGAEGGLIDDWLLPQCHKLCMEYHFSRLPSREAFQARVKILRQRFDRVEVQETGYEDILVLAWKE